MPRLLIHFARYGPYHLARLRSAREALAPLGWEVIGLETAGNDETYAWEETHPAGQDPQVVTAFPNRFHENITAADCRRALLPLLDQWRPDAMAIAGWGSADGLACLSWCRKNHVRRIVMSETRAADGHRVWWKELLKRYFISRYDGALVGGPSHRDYLVGLGMKKEHIAFGYNVVDNEYFARQDSSSTEPRAVPPYFLSSNRFIPRKNLLRLIDAYASYCQSTRTGAASEQWNLCLLGDGQQKPELIARCRGHNLAVLEGAPWDDAPGADQSQGAVWMPGFRQIDELPRFYAHAGCFIHPALEEPWGLVINEAMACGLIILAGDNVGAAESLVEDGVNGWRFDATDTEALAKLMRRVAAGAFPSSAFREASLRILGQRAPTAAFGLGLKQLLTTHPIFP